MLSTVEVRHTWDLEATAIDEYRAVDTWESVAFSYRGDEVEEGAEELLGGAVESQPFVAHASCGTLYVDRHDVNVPFGAIVAWLVDALVFVSTDGEERDLASALLSFEGWFCEGAAGAADLLSQELGGPDVFWLAELACEAVLAESVDLALAALDEALLDLPILRLEGRATIVDGELLDEGRWMGTLGGADVTGDFWAVRE